jgi:hypothetical protein
VSGAGSFAIGVADSQFLIFDVLAPGELKAEALTIRKAWPSFLAIRDTRCFPWTGTAAFTPSPFSLSRFFFSILRFLFKLLNWTGGVSLCALDGCFLSASYRSYSRTWGGEGQKDTLFTVPPGLRTLILLPSFRLVTSPSDEIDKSKEDPSDGQSLR